MYQQYSNILRCNFQDMYMSYKMHFTVHTYNVPHENYKIGST
jgi:hypothetical protein